MIEDERLELLIRGLEERCAELEGRVSLLEDPTLRLSKEDAGELFELIGDPDDDDPDWPHNYLGSG